MGYIDRSDLICFIENVFVEGLFYIGEEVYFTSNEKDDIIKIIKNLPEDYMVYMINNKEIHDRLFSPYQRQKYVFADKEKTPIYSINRGYCTFLFQTPKKIENLINGATWYHYGVVCYLENGRIWQALFTQIDNNKYLVNHEFFVYADGVGEAIKKFFSDYDEKIVDYKVEIVNAVYDKVYTSKGEKV